MPALEHRALLALLPFLPPDTAALRSLAARLRREPAAGLSASLETSHLANLHDGVHEELRAYLLGGLALRLGDTATAVAQLEPLRVPRAVPGAAAVGRDADGGLRAQLEIRRGRPDEAARTLEEVFRLEARVD